MIDRAEIERLAKEQICGGNDPQTPYERGAVQQLVAFGIRVAQIQSQATTITIDGWHGNNCYCSLCANSELTAER